MNISEIKNLLNERLNDCRDVLNERILNITSIEDKRKYGDRVFEILSRSYEEIGGLKGSGFASVEDMINNIPFWKLVKKDGEIVVAHMYKDKEGRKMVACGSDLKKDNRAITKKFLLDDLTRNRSYMEVSGKVLDYIKRILSNEEYYRYAIPAKKVNELFPDKKIEIISEYEYKRKLGSGDDEIKVMFGTLHQPIPKSE